MNKQTQELLRRAINAIEELSRTSFYDDLVDALTEALEAEQVCQVQKPVLIQWYDEEEEEWEDTDERYYKHYEEEGHKIRFLYTKEQL